MCKEGHWIDVHSVTEHARDSGIHDIKEASEAEQDDSVSSQRINLIKSKHCTYDQLIVTLDF
jgi:hypothetical protein